MDIDSRAAEVSEIMEESALIRSYVSQFVLSKLDNIHEEDAVTLFSILLEIGLIEPQRVSEGEGFRYREFRWDWESHFRRRGNKISDTNRTKRRVHTLSVGNYRDPFREYRIQRVLGLLEKLQGLEHLTLVCRDSLAVAELVSRFPNLRYLKITSSFNAIGNRPVNVGPSSLLKGMARLSKLETLLLFGHTMEGEDDLAAFLFGVLPFVPNLSTLRVGYNKIQSFQEIAKRIHKLNELPKSPTRLRTLDLGQPLVAKRKDQFLLHDPLEANAMQTILLGFPELGDIGSIAKHYKASRVHYLLEINHAGCVLVEHTQIVENNYNSATTMPLSVWPTVLERAWEKRGSADGIYYLLQNVQELRNGGNRETETLEQ